MKFNQFHRSFHRSLSLSQRKHFVSTYWVLKQSRVTFVKLSLSTKKESNFSKKIMKKCTTSFPSKENFKQNYKISK